MKTVAAIYTAISIIEPIKALFSELMPGHRLVNVYDDSLIPDVISAGNSVTTDIRRRLLAYCRATEDMGADLILSTCSSMGDIVGQIQPFVRVPILRIDEPMVRQAIELGSSIAILATVDTTLVPTNRLVRATAGKLGKPVEVVEGLARGALQALNEGKAELHDQILMQAALAVADKADVILLAQGSMARMQETIARATGKPVLSSLRPGLQAVSEALQEQDEKNLCIC
jgi:aspartate/glutamate racemase